MSEINQDHLVGYIMRTLNEDDINVFYKDVKAVLDAEKEYLERRKIAEGIKSGKG